MTTTDPQIAKQPASFENDCSAAGWRECQHPRCRGRMRTNGKGPGFMVKLSDEEMRRLAAGFYRVICHECKTREYGDEMIQDKGFKPGDTIRLPHYETAGGFRVWSVQGVHLGGNYQEGTYHLRAVDVSENKEIQVPCIMLEMHPSIERV